MVSIKWKRFSVICVCCCVCSLEISITIKGLHKKHVVIVSLPERYQSQNQGSLISFLIGVCAGVLLQVVIVTSNGHQPLSAISFLSPSVGPS